ncbi:hypothetical protein CL614_05760 [archaeon]|jgi:hypothetical protein|nr:hypothetical protein [archaeon]|tara:strand:+ start:517 stop:771 length:255 start_codon:yes stop_codon:yes gene_type:complete
MNKLDQDKLARLVGDSALLQAVKNVFDAGIEKARPDIEKTDNDQILGEKYRAYIVAKNLLEEVLKDIDSYKDTKVVSNKIDKGK